MKITKGRLIQIIKEEIEVSTLREGTDVEEHFLDHPDDEGGMMLGQINRIGGYAAKLADEIDESKQYPSWVQSKLTLAADYMRSVNDWFDRKANDPRPVHQQEEPDESYRKEKFMAP